MSNSILDKLAKNDFLLKVLERFYQNFNCIFNFFHNFKSKVCSQDFATNELKVDLLSDLVIFKLLSFVDPEPCRLGVKG